MDLSHHDAEPSMPGNLNVSSSSAATYNNFKIGQSFPRTTEGFYNEAGFSAYDENASTFNPKSSKFTGVS